MPWARSLVIWLCLGIGNCWADDCKDAFIRMTTELYRLDGYRNPDKYPEVYRDGFKTSMLLSVTQASNSPDVVIYSMRLDLQRFFSGKRPEYAQKRDLNYIYGAGPAKPRVFVVTLAGSQVNRAHWGKDSSSVRAKSDNFLETDDREFQAFPVKPGKNAEIKGTVLASKTGLYDLIFRFGYRTPNTAGECRTSPIRVYQDEDE